MTLLLSLKRCGNFQRIIRKQWTTKQRYGNMGFHEIKQWTAMQIAFIISSAKLISVHGVKNISL